MGTHTTETKGQGRVGQTSCTIVHKANIGSQLSIFDTGVPLSKDLTWTPSNDPPSNDLARMTRPNELTQTPSNDPPERVDTDALK